MVVIVGRWWVQQKQIVAAAERLPYQFKNSTRAKRHEERQNEECSMSMKNKIQNKKRKGSLWGGRYYSGHNNSTRYKFKFFTNKSTYN